MLITWNYKERNTIIQKLDPRGRIIFLLCAMVAIMQFWDLRFVAFFLLLGIVQFVLAKLSWRETRRFWLVIGIIATILSLATALTGRGEAGVYADTHFLWEPTPFHLLGLTLSPRLSAERVMYLVSQLTRIMSFALLAVVIPFTIHPAQYGITFRRLGLPDKLAFAVDLAFRFIPSLGRDFTVTMDAQKARGYELERVGIGLIGQIRNMAPLLIPITIGSVVGGEEVIDAMDLRAFGTGPRTWLKELKYQPRDYVLIAFSLLILLGSLTLNLLDIGELWMPLWLQRLAG
ncbi:MAG: energy-coupling factor transporter transmembrane protein EcfT [Chloroflexi bacterium]|nr:energy-coupling factor transporter transmembrane protein EcfT [Chloroflexota bacterium]